VNATLLHTDGTPVNQKVLQNGQYVLTPATQAVPNYQIITPGGDTHAVFNFEYRIPIFGPVTLAPFFDVGVNRVVFTNQLKVNEGQVTTLNNQFPQAAFSDKVKIAPGTQAIRSSTGLELQVILPVVQAPFRIYWAYNPTVAREYLQAPIVLDPSTFNNSTTFLNTINTYSPIYPYFDKRSTFRFTIGRTF
jgi:outer membrane protein insertion porin family